MRDLLESNIARVATMVKEMEVTTMRDHLMSGATIMEVIVAISVGLR